MVAAAEKKKKRKKKEEETAEEEEEEEEAVALRRSLGGVDVGVAFRMFVLSHHYRSNITYSLDRMRDASADVRRFETFVDEMESFATKKKEMRRRKVLEDRSESEEVVDGVALLARR
jgi:hypothetical protein